MRVVRLTSGHDLFRKPASTPDQVGAGFFGIMLYPSLWVFVSPVGAPSIAVQPPSTSSAVPVM